MKITIPSSGYIRVVLLAALASGLTIALSGCLFNRVMEVRQQFCDFDSNFSVEFTESVTLHLAHPVILEKDILWLAGAEPTSVTRTGDLVTMVFVIEEDLPVPDPAQDIGFELDFARIGDDFGLTQIRMDPKLSTVLNPENIDRESLLNSADNICQTGLSFGSRSVEFDLDDQDLEQLPSRTEALAIMGPPHSLVDEGAGWTWQYRLKGHNESNNSARFTVWFDETSQKPLRMESQYARYRTNADFIAKKVSMNVEL